MLVIDQMIEGSVVYADSFKINKDNFTLKIPHKGTALMNISIPQSNIRNLMMVAEEGLIRLNIEGATTQFGGTPLNDRLQAFYHGNDSVASLFRQIDNQTRDDSITPEMRKELGQKRTQLLDENTDRIVAFIRENVDNIVGEYYFITHYITFSLDRKLELSSFATERLKQEFGLK
jgi:hypothetical protein